MSTVDDPLVKLDDVEIHFRDEGIFGASEEVVKAVDGVTLDIEENEVIALVGESGCGKTTLGKAAVGLERPTGGSVSYRGQDVWDAKEGVGETDISYRRIRRALGIIHQDPGSSLNPNRTVMTNAKVPLKRYRPDMTEDQREQTVHKLLERMGMTPSERYVNRFPHQLSGGEKQRVVLARSLLMEPDLVLADEAVSALDVSLRVEMMDLMLELQDLFNTSYLFISHDFSNARYLAKKADGRIGVMYLGKLVEIGTADQILKEPKHPYTKTLVWSSPSLDPTVAEEETLAEPPVRTADIPDPKNPPSGCNFHTRCPKVIIPPDTDVDQKTYNDVMTLRHAIESEELEVERIFDRLGVDFEEPEERRAHAGEFVTRVRDSYMEPDVPQPHRGRIEEALEQVAIGEWETAASMLSEDYESVCETVEPDLPIEDHPAACHLFSSVSETGPESAD